MCVCGGGRGHRVSAASPTHNHCGACEARGPGVLLSPTPSIGALVQVPWARKLWCATVANVDGAAGWLVVDWHGYPAWRRQRHKLQGVRHPLPDGASCIGRNAYCPSHHLTEHWAYCSMALDCPCPECRKSNHDDICFVCKEGGKLMMCEACNNVAHYRCMGLRETPVGDWLCPSCCPKPACNLPWRHGGKSNVLSLFDGIAIGRQALKELGFKELGGYHAFEVDSKAIRVATSNHSDITQHGGVCQVWVPTPHLAICTVVHIVLNSYCNLCCTGINLYCVQLAEVPADLGRQAARHC